MTRLEQDLPKFVGPRAKVVDLPAPWRNPDSQREPDNVAIANPRSLTNFDLKQIGNDPERL